MCHPGLLQFWTCYEKKWGPIKIGLFLLVESMTVYETASNISQVAEIFCNRDLKLLFLQQIDINAQFLFKDG